MGMGTGFCRWGTGFVSARGADFEGFCAGGCVGAANGMGFGGDGGRSEGLEEVKGLGWSRNSVGISAFSGRAAPLAAGAGPFFTRVSIDIFGIGNPHFGQVSWAGPLPRNLSINWLPHEGQMTIDTLWRLWHCFSYRQ
jgi:hypothetical protein